MPSDEHLEALKKKLYERAPRGVFTVRRSKLNNPYTGERATFSSSLAIPPRRSFIAIGLILSLIFFVAAVGYGAYSLFFAPQYVSTSDVTLTVDGPAEISGGDIATFNVSIANNNAVPLSSAVLIVEYPAGTKDAESGSQDLSRERIPLDTINPGEAINRSLRALMFGSGTASSSVHVALEYRLPQSNALYVKEQSFLLAFASPPVDVVLKLPEEIPSNQDMALTVSVISRAKKMLHNVGLMVQYPPGFQFIGADPTPTASSAFWKIGDLAPGDERTITINGSLEGQHEEVKGFHVTVGESDPRGSGRIVTVYSALFEKVNIARPALALSTAISGERTETVTVLPLKDVLFSINWENTLAVAVTNARIVATFTGAEIDPASVRSGKGYYNSRENTITWDATQEKSLASIPAGARGSVQGSFKLKQTSSESPIVTLKVLATATRVSEGFENEPVFSDITRTVRFITSAGLATDSYYSVGPFANSGPIPPRVDQKTSYTVTWALSNSLNKITEASVQTTLPLYVEWEGETSPDTETLKFNPTSRTVLWSAGTLESNTGLSPDGVPRSVSFKVSITPSVSHIGQALSLTGPSEFNGIDSFTSQAIKTSRPAVTTKITKDPQYRNGSETVRSGDVTP